MTATASTTVVTNRAKATSACATSGPMTWRPTMPTLSEAPRMVRMAMPDTGEFDEPIRPAM